jgi:transposase-like protein
MSLHFLLQTKARTLSVVQVLAMSDDDAFALFRDVRWGNGEKVVCPHCGMAHRHDFRPARKIWRCAGCQDDFSVTSGTIFAFHKLPLRLYLAAVILFANAVKGISALQVGRDLGVSHKTAYVLLHKIRESLLVGREESALQGEIHVDWAYVGPGKSGLVRVLAGQPPTGGKPGGVKASGDRPGGAVPVTAGRAQGAGTLQAMHDANGVLPHLLDHDGGRFQTLACRQRLADLAAAQRCALSLAEDVQNQALAFPRPEETAPYPVGLGPDRPQVDFRGKQLEGGVKVGQIIRQTLHFLLMMLDQPGALADQGRDHVALRHEQCSCSLKTREFSPG